MNLKTRFTLSILLFFVVVGLMGSYINVSSQQPQDYEFVHVSHEQQTQAQVIKGNTSDSDLELLISNLLIVNTNTRAGGNPTIIRDNGMISVQGDLSAGHSQSFRLTETFYQKSSYVPDVPTNQRFHNERAGESGNVLNVQFDESMQEPILDNFRSNDAFTEINDIDRDLTGFYVKGGILGSAIINDSNGDEIGKVIGFHLSLTLIVFQTSTSQFVAFHTDTVTGHGNILPQGLIAALRENDIVDNADPDAFGTEQLQSADADSPSVRWIDGGYNATLDLNVYLGIFQLSRSIETLMIAPSAQSLALNAVSVDLESFINEIDAENTVIIDEIAADEFQNDVVDQVLEEAAITIVDDQSNSITNVESIDINQFSKESASIINSQTILAGQIMVLLVLGGILYRKFH